MRRLVDDVIADYNERSVTGALPPLTDRSGSRDPDTGCVSRARRSTIPLMRAGVATTSGRSHEQVPPSVHETSDSGSWGRSQTDRASRRRGGTLREVELELDVVRISKGDE
jgi:hypothetical protein